MQTQNNFNLLRLIAAWMILWGHSFTLYDRSADIFTRYLRYDEITSLALAVFFTISGYLVTLSWMRRKSAGHYALSRALRILPGLGMALIFCAVIIGPIATTLTLSEYSSSAETWKYLRGILVFPISYTLPGVFEQLSYPNAVNGSLWSLKIEVRSYILLALIGSVGLLRPKITVSFTIACLISYAMLINMEQPSKRLGGFKYSDLTAHAHWLFFFFAGSSLYQFKERVPLNARLALLVLLLDIFCWYLIPLGQFIHMLCLPYLIIYLALKAPLVQTPAQRHDISYGIYLYAFPLQQLYMQFAGTQHGFTAFVLCSTLSSFVMACLSWRYVEHPFLKLKRNYQPGIREPKHAF